MNVMKWIAAGFGVIFALITFGCGGSSQLTTRTIDDARAQVNSAREAGAESLASQDLAEAEQMLARAEAALTEGKKEAGRLSLRAYLKAKVAEASAVASQMEGQARDVEDELELKAQAAEAARREAEEAKRELEALESTP
jgi:hypothetical protein